MPRTKIRRAVHADAKAIAGFDHIAQTDPSRSAFIRRSVESRQCYVAVSRDSVIAYGVLEYSFYSYGFISMLYVHPQHRRRGVGSALMRHMEQVCTTEKLFTSTNRSNAPMQALLEKLGYARSGIIHNLDEGDPELIYVKRPVQTERTA